MPKSMRDVVMDSIWGSTPDWGNANGRASSETNGIRSIWWCGWRHTEVNFTQYGAPMLELSPEQLAVAEKLPFGGSDPMDWNKAFREPYNQHYAEHRGGVDELYENSLQFIRRNMKEFRRGKRNNVDAVRRDALAFLEVDIGGVNGWLNAFPHISSAGAEAIDAGAVKIADAVFQMFVAKAPSWWNQEIRNSIDAKTRSSSR
jgi:hypothetical protein